MNKMVITIFLIISFLAYPLQIKAKGNKSFFSCERGFDFEVKNKASRCIKQERVIYKKPESCNKKHINLKNYELHIDMMGQKDYCVLSPRSRATQTGKIQQKTALQPQFMPRCASGFQLKVRHGKDDCIKTSAEIIKPANRRIRIP